MSHQGLSPALGNYTYTVTPRRSPAVPCQRWTPPWSVAVTVPVGPFKKARLRSDLPGGTCNRKPMCITLEKTAPVVPNLSNWISTPTRRPTDNNGQPVTFAQIYNWMGETARSRSSTRSTGGQRSEPHAQGVRLRPQRAGHPENPVRAGGAGTGAHHSGQRVFARHPRGANVKTPENQFTDLFKQRKKKCLISYAERSHWSRTTRFLSSREAPSSSSPAPRTFP